MGRKPRTRAEGEWRLGSWGEDQEMPRGYRGEDGFSLAYDVFETLSFLGEESRMKVRTQGPSTFVNPSELMGYWRSPYSSCCRFKDGETES